MPFNIRKFRDAIDTIAKPSHFEVFFVGLPLKIFPYGSDQLKLTDDYKFRGFNIQLPGINMDTIERRYHGPIRQLPVGVMYQPVGVSLIDTHDYKIRELFDYWVNFICNPSEGYFIDYYDEVVASEMFLYLYDPEGYLIRKYIFEEVYPMSVNGVNLDWGLRDTFITTNIELVYRKWRVEKVKPFGEISNTDPLPLTD